MQHSTELIAARWRDLTDAVGADRNAVEAELGNIVAAYVAPSRHYHDIGHIGALLALSCRHRARLSDPAAVDLAILYHDLVYDPARVDNEQASADVARERLAVLGFPAARVAKVAHYIEATQHVGGPGEASAEHDTDRDHLLDFDLSILAAEPSAYDDYATAIRREYQVYPDDRYRVGRAVVLRRLLAMPRLYRVPGLAATWEAAARANLAGELKRLGGVGPG